MNKTNKTKEKIHKVMKKYEMPSLKVVRVNVQNMYAASPVPGIIDEGEMVKEEIFSFE